MLQFDNDVQKLKYKVLREVACSAYKGTLTSDAFKIPEKIVPGPEPTMRCCIYKERAIVQARVALAMGGDPENKNVVEVMKIACDECPLGGYVVTPNCRGCLAHNCQKACRRDAISFDPITKKCVIDKTKCVNCGMCAKTCPYHAIQELRRPCELACKVKAISPAADKAASIDNDKCIQCGACVYSCPFGAIVEKSEIVQLIEAIKDSDYSKKYPIYAILAPAFASQVQGETIPQLVTGVKTCGFKDAIEVAVGADIVSINEGRELAEKGFLTSSCCPAFVNYIRKYKPTLADKISSNPSPMVALGKFLKEREPNCKVCFVGPCIAKKGEARRPENAPYVDFVITFDELNAMFYATEAHVTKAVETKIEDASCYGRSFAVSGGLSNAVVASLEEQNINFTVNPLILNGLDEVKLGLSKAMVPNSPYNFVEGMICNGGCIGGPSNLLHEPKEKAMIENFAKTSVKKTIRESFENFKK